MWIAWLPACVPPPTAPVAPGTTPSTTAGTSTTAPDPTGLDLPVGPSLVVDPLVAATLAAVSVAGAAPGAAITLWRGTFGGTSCPPELGGSCVPVGDATIALAGTADAAGTLATDWPVPATEPIGGYPVLVATADAATRSLPVMRRVWLGAPDLDTEEALDPFDDATWGAEEAPFDLPPGDWMDLALDGAGDTFTTWTRGNTTVTADAVFRPYMPNVMLGRVEAPGSERALDHLDWDTAPPSTVTLNGMTLATGTWSAEIEADYGEHQGMYDLAVRHAIPTEPRTWYGDADADGYGDPAEPVDAPVAPDGASWSDEDCDDADPAVNPDAWDVCDDGADADCTGTDKPCHGAPATDGAVAAFAGARADLGDAPAPWDLAGVGDADGDGVPEVWGRDHDRVWRIEGHPGDVPAVQSLADASGWGSTRAGDFDHDGVADLAYGGGDLAPEGAVLLVATPATPTDVAAAAWATLVGPSEGSDAGEGLDVGGDVDGDDWPDLLVVADEVDTVWLVTAAVPGTTALDSAAKATLAWAGAGEAWVAAASDLDGDGLAEVLVGTDQTLAFVVRAPSGATDLAAAAHATLDAGARLVGRLAAGDTDGDGLGEVVLGSWEASTVWVFEDPDGAVSTAGTTVEVPRFGGLFALADLDADGADDLVTAEPGDAWTGRGLVEIAYGPLPAALSMPEDASVVLGPREDETTAADLWSGDFDADGGDDLAVLGWDSGTLTLDLLYGIP